MNLLDKLNEIEANVIYRPKIGEQPKEIMEIDKKDLEWMYNTIHDLYNKLVK